MTARGDISAAAPVVQDCLVHIRSNTSAVTMFEGRHFDQSVILLCARWYLAYGISVRNLKEMLPDRGNSVDHSTIHRWVVNFSPPILDRFNSRMRAVTDKWHADEAYIRVRVNRCIRTMDSIGDR